MILAASNDATLELTNASSADRFTIRISEYDDSSRSAEIVLSGDQINAILNSLILTRNLWKGPQPHADTPSV